MSRYAADTSVSVAKSRAEIEDTLQRYGATHFGSAMEPRRAVVGFRANDRSVRFALPLPDPEEFRMKVRSYAGRQKPPVRRTDEDTRRTWEQACRQRWRALSLAIKAKLEAVETGITTFEEEFLAHLVMPDGHTVGERALPQIAEAYKTGRVAPLLLLSAGRGKS